MNPTGILTTNHRIAERPPADVSWLEMEPINGRGFMSSLFRRGKHRPASHRTCGEWSFTRFDAPCDAVRTVCYSCKRPR